MYCPNCSAQNKKKQNYCRFCGLSLHEIERSYLNQLVFGEDTKAIKTFRNVRKFIDYAELLVIVAVVVALLTVYFSGYAVKMRLVPIGIGIVFLFDIARRIIRNFEQKSFRENTKRKTLTETNKSEFETRETAKLIEEKAYVPAASVTENSTQLLGKSIIARPGKPE